jgi:hypothetical protein
MDPRRLDKSHKITYGFEYTRNPQLEVFDYISNIGKPSTVLKLGANSELRSNSIANQGKADAARKL